MLKIGHEVVRPGKVYGDTPVTIPVPEELETGPGIPTNDRQVDWYAREHPLESPIKSERASGDWSGTLRDSNSEMRAIRKEHHRLDEKLVAAGRATAALEPTAEPTGEDVTELIRDRAKQLGYLEVGFAAYDIRSEVPVQAQLYRASHCHLPDVRAGLRGHTDHSQLARRNRPLQHV